MAKEDVIIHGVTYPTVPSMRAKDADNQSQYVTFYYTGDATGTAAHLLYGDVLYGPNGEVVGTMTDRSGFSGTVTNKNLDVVIPAGFHDGTGSVGLSSNDKNNLVSGNLRSGVTVLGVSGSSTVVDTSDATATAAQILNGETAYVNGQKLTGTLTTISVSQDSTTHVLTIL